MINSILSRIQCLQSSLAQDGGANLRPQCSVKVQKTLKTLIKRSQELPEIFEIVLGPIWWVAGSEQPSPPLHRAAAARLLRRSHVLRQYFFPPSTPYFSMFWKSYFCWTESWTNACASTQHLLIITAAAHISRLYLSKWWIVFPNSKSDHLGHFYTESSSQSKEQVEKLNPKDAGIKQWHNFAPPSWIWQDEVYFQVSWGTWLIYTSPHPVIQSQSSSLILTVLSSLEFVGVSKICAQIFAHFSILTKLPKICALFLQSFQIWQNCPKSVLNFDTLFKSNTRVYLPPTQQLPRTAAHSLLKYSNCLFSFDISLSDLPIYCMCKI